jgi:hypothetical protein
VSESDTSNEQDRGWVAGYDWAKTHADPWGMKPIADGDVGFDELRAHVADESLPPAADQEFWSRFVAGVASRLVDDGIYLPATPDEYV